jgi:hypothetical protein
MVAANIAHGMKPKSGNKKLSPEEFARKVAAAHRREIAAAHALVAARDADALVDAMKAAGAGKGGTRKYRTRKRGIRRKSRKASGTRRMQKRKRTMKRK